MRHPKLALRPVFFACACAFATAATFVACVGDVPSTSPKEDAAAPAPEAAAPIAKDSGTGTDPDAQPPPDTGPVDAGTDTGIPAKATHCQGTVAPPGATDFLCADFDTAGFGAWTQIRQDDGGALEKITAVAVSPPNSLGARARNATAGGAALVWGPTGAMNFVEATAHVMINPTSLGGVVAPTSGSVDLLDIRTQTTSVTFSATRGGSGETANYSGYFLKLAAFGGAAVLTMKNVGTPLTPSTWTDVKLVYRADGSVKLLFNNLTIVSVMGYSANDPSVTFQVGAEGTFTNSVPEEFRYDDVELSVRR